MNCHLLKINFGFLDRTTFTYPIVRVEIYCCTMRHIQQDFLDE